MLCDRQQHWDSVYICSTSHHSFPYYLTKTLSISKHSCQREQYDCREMDTNRVDVSQVKPPQPHPTLCGWPCFLSGFICSLSCSGFLFFYCKETGQIHNWDHVSHRSMQLHQDRAVTKSNKKQIVCWPIRQFGTPDGSWICTCITVF